MGVPVLAGHAHVTPEMEACTFSLLSLIFLTRCEPRSEFRCMVISCLTVDPAEGMISAYVKPFNGPGA